MEGEIKRFGIDGAEVCMTSIAGRGRGAEREATQRLVEAMFGSGTVLGHTACGAPKVEGYGDGRVSVSHGAGCAVVALCGHGVRVGVDVESAREQLRRVTGRILTAAERKVLPLPEQCDIRLLQRIWTAKEAVYKLTPENGRMTLGEIDVLRAEDLDAWRRGDSIVSRGGARVSFVELEGDGLLAVATMVSSREGRG